MWRSAPLLAIPVIAYNMIAFGSSVGGGAEAAVTRLDQILLSVPMASGGVWAMSLGDLIISFALVMLFAELLRATRSGRTSITNHALSMLVFIACLVEFLLLPAFATSVFFILTLMTLLDVLAGFIVTIATARRDIGVADNFVD